MREPGPPIKTVEDRRRLCLWLLDKVRTTLPVEDRALAQDIYAIEHKLNEQRPVERFSGEELIRLRLLGPVGDYLYETMLSIPLYAEKPSFEGQTIVVVPSYINQQVRLNLEVQGERVRYAS